MDQLLRGLEDCAAAYLDDLVIHNATWPEHLASLRNVLERLRTAGLTAKPSKCHFAMKECTYQGHIVGNGQVRPEIGKLTAVEDFPVPKTKKEVRTFLGLTGYYRKFVPCYASLAAPLTELTRSNAPTIVKWTTSCTHIHTCICSMCLFACTCMFCKYACVRSIFGTIHVPYMYGTCTVHVRYMYRYICAYGKLAVSVLQCQVLTYTCMQTYCTNTCTCTQTTCSHMGHKVQLCAVVH